MFSYGLFVVLLITVTSSKLFVTSAQVKLQLHLVNVVFRHGDRTPETYENGEFYPNDPYLNRTFPEGYGQLTHTGKLRSYSLGKHLRQLYGSFLNHQYVPEEVYARSSDMDRTKMTLQNVLSALFPPESYDQGHLLSKRQPIPIVYCPVEADRILRPDESPLCDIQSADDYKGNEFLKAADQLLLSSKVSDRIAPYSELLQQLTKLTGRLITNPRQLLNLHNTLSSEMFLGLELPAWAKHIYSSDLFLNASSLFYQIIDENQNLKKMSPGILLRRMVDNMLDKVDNHKTNKKKIYLYSAHDTNVGPILAALGLYAAPYLPKYTSAVMIELLSWGCHCYVKACRDILWNQWIGETRQVRHYEGIPAQSTIKTIPGCTELCPLEQFIKLIEHNLASSEEVRGYC